MLALLLPEFAPAPVVTSAAMAARARSRTSDLREIFFTSNLLLFYVAGRRSSTQKLGIASRYGPAELLDRSTLSHPRPYVKCVTNNLRAWRDRLAHPR
jgi:hypothetical protein